MPTRTVKSPIEKPKNSSKAFFEKIDGFEKEHKALLDQLFENYDEIEPKILIGKVKEHREKLRREHQELTTPLITGIVHIPLSQEREVKRAIHITRSFSEEHKNVLRNAYARPGQVNTRFNLVNKIANGIMRFVHNFNTGPTRPISTYEAGRLVENIDSHYDEKTKPLGQLLKKLEAAYQQTH